MCADFKQKSESILIVWSNLFCDEAASAPVAGCTHIFRRIPCPIAKNGIMGVL